MRLTHSPTTIFTSAGVRRSPRLVEPTMSANRAVTGRSSSSAPAGAGGRSSTRGSGAAGTTAAAAGAAFASSAARGASPGIARTVRPSSTGSARTSMELVPTVMTSPAASRFVPTMRSPFTQVPLSDPRSSTSIESSAGRTNAWRREMSGSSMVISAFRRPTTSWDSIVNRRPASGPSLSTSDGTRSV